MELAVYYLKNLTIIFFTFAVIRFLILRNVFETGQTIDEPLYLDTRNGLFITRSKFIELNGYREIQEFFGDPEEVFEELVKEGVLVGHKINPSLN